LTLDEKISLLGQNQPAIPRLGVKFFTTYSEGLHGIGWANPGQRHYVGTIFPQSYGLAQTWDPETVSQVGAVEGYEVRVYHNKHAGKYISVTIRTPMVDMGRDPRWGRTEECFGEDPYLVGQIGLSFVRGLQGDHPKYILVAATLKHFLANNNERRRTSTSSNFDERNLREYYLVPFKKCLVDGNAQSFMTAYNLVNNIPATVNPIIQNIVVKEWKFDGMICTDAGALRNLTRSQSYYQTAGEAAAGAIKAGTNVFLDRFEQPVREALENQLLTEEDIDNVIKGNFRMRMRLGEFDPPEMVPYNQISGNEEPWLSEKHKTICRTVTQKTIVLLKNENKLLPLNKDNLNSIAVIGSYADSVLMDWYSGIPPYTVSPFEGIKSNAGENVTVKFAADNTNNAAVTIARESDVVILIMGNHPTCNAGWAETTKRSEGKEAVDRETIEFEPEDKELIKQVYAANPKTIFVLVSSFPYAMNWTKENIPAILHMTHCSQEQGNALADALFGDINPGGRLIQTWPRSLDQLPNIMDYNIRNGRTYMYFKDEPLYPFGYGLSYTTFEYSNLNLSSERLRENSEILVRIDVTNTGNRAGDEVVQLYVKHLESKVERPQKELRGFKRITIQPNETITVVIPLKAETLAYWNEQEQRFIVEKGRVQLMVGTSSADVKLEKTISIIE